MTQAAARALASTSSASESGGLRPTGQVRRPASPRHGLPLRFDADHALQPCIRVDTLIRRGRRAELLLAARAWGATLAALHRHPADDTVVETELPWILTAFDGPARPAPIDSRAADSAQREARARGMLGELREAATVRSAAAVVRRGWRAASWTHGSPGAANVVVSPLDRMHSYAWLIDTGTAGRSDPSWDLVTAYDSLLRHRGDLGADLRPAVRALLDGYRAGNGPGRVDGSLVLTRSALTWVEMTCAP